MIIDLNQRSLLDVKALALDLFLLCDRRKLTSKSLIDFDFLGDQGIFLFKLIQGRIDRLLLVVIVARSGFIDFLKWAQLNTFRRSESVRAARQGIRWQSGMSHSHLFLVVHFIILSLFEALNDYLTIQRMDVLGRLSLVECGNGAAMSQGHVHIYIVMSSALMIDVVLFNHRSIYFVMAVFV